MSIIHVTTNIQNNEFTFLFSTENYMSIELLFYMSTPLKKDHFGEFSGYNLLGCYWRNET